MTPPKPPQKQRLDVLLVERGLVTDAKKAQALIMAGEVVVEEQRASHAGEVVSTEARIRLKSEPKAFVSRAGVKLAKLIQSEQLDDWFQGASVLDVGASTGGFTDCALQFKAKQVTAVDVGTNQLVWSLRNDKRVQCLEQTDIRNLRAKDLPSIQLILVDVSFISLTTILPQLAELAKAQLNDDQPTLKCIFLVKPQFELPREKLPEGGVVSDQELENQALDRVARSLVDHGFQILMTTPSALKGREGNQEHFCLCEMRYA